MIFTNKVGKCPTVPCLCMMQPFKTHTPVFLDKDTLASILWIHIIDVEIPV